MTNYDTIDKMDLTVHSDQELSLLVYNTEYLYHQRNRLVLRQILEAEFIFSESQWETLEADLNLEQDED